MAARQHHQAEGFANSGSSIWTRRHWRKTARQWSTVEAQATERLDELAAPIRERIENELHSAEIRVSHLEGQASTRGLWLEQHPDLAYRIAAIDRELDPTPSIQQRLQALQVEPPGRGRGLGLEL